MKKILILFLLSTFGLAFSQFSEFKNIDKTVEKKYKEIDRKYKKQYPEERKKEEAEIENYKSKEYGKAIENIQKDEVKVDLNSIPKDYTKEAEYEKGINEFRKIFMENFDTSMLSGESGTSKAILRFLIDEKGKVSNASVDGYSIDFNQETLITFYKIKDKGNWIPAEKNGTPVKSVFQMPLTMNFE